METLPLVTVVCTCYNHKEFVEEALLSVLEQTYPNIQLIVIDNASNDQSLNVIKKVRTQGRDFLVIENKVNKGICKAFNDALAFVKGKYVVDLSADDVFLKDRIQIQVTEFEKLDESYGMMYSNIEYINEAGKITGTSAGKKNYPSGKIFKDLLKEYLIPAPSTIFKTEAFKKTGGYNENLAFEDFDFWIRCSWYYNIHFLPEITTQKRVLSNSLSTQFYAKKNDQMLRSTFQTYRWAYEKLVTEEEFICFQEGLGYYFRQAVLLGHLQLAKEILAYLKQSKNVKTVLAVMLLKLKSLLKK